MFDPVELSRVYAAAVRGDSLADLAAEFEKRPREIWLMLISMGGPPGGQTWFASRPPAKPRKAKQQPCPRCRPPLFTSDERVEIERRAEAGEPLHVIAKSMGRATKSVYTVVPPPGRVNNSDRARLTREIVTLRERGFTTREIAEYLELPFDLVSNLYRRRNSAKAQAARRERAAE